MFSRSLVFVAIFALFFQTSITASSKVGRSYAGSKIGRGATNIKHNQRRAKASKTKSPKAPTASRSPTTSDVTDVSDATSAPSATPSEVDLLDDSNSTVSKSANVTLVCDIDDDCDDGWFCMEMLKQCCEYNTTCKITPLGMASTSSAPSSISYYGTFASSLISGIALMFTIWP